jgi:hypothetical protein
VETEVHLAMANAEVVVDLAGVVILVVENLVIN